VLETERVKLLTHVPNFNPGGADQRGIHQLQNRTLAEGVRDHLGAPPFLAEQPLEQIGGADRPSPTSSRPSISALSFSRVRSDASILSIGVLLR
jgi:hypothetical protein